jgi:sulfane dehydrogenase subunit SoxC
MGIEVRMRKDADPLRALGNEVGVAANGLLHRRLFLRGGAMYAAFAAATGLTEVAEASEFPPAWRTKPGRPFTPYGMPSRFEEGVQRLMPQRPPGHPTPGAGATFTPLQLLEGTITPNGLHYERSHNGVPDIDPSQHSLIVHGLVRQSLVFTMDALMRYPTLSRVHFLECTGNSLGGWTNASQPGPLGRMHGLLSCAEWTGIPLSTVLSEAGVDPKAKWILAEGIDAAGMSRSVPLAKCMDDAMLALYQNGERIRPEQGYPLRLFLPGYEGNMSVKWIHRIKVTEGPTFTKDETSKYTDLLPDGRALQFTFNMDVKSTITRPSEGLMLAGPGLYEISGLAWSGAGRIARVDVSADGGKSWAPAALQEPVLPKALARFRLAWRWDGRPVTLQSRATDEKGNVQPTRDSLIAARGTRSVNHYNGITSFHVSSDGQVRNGWT